MTTLRRQLLTAFQPLPVQMKAAVAVVFAWMLLFSAVGTIGLYKAQDLSNSRYKEQKITAAAADLNCYRAKRFGPELLNAYARMNMLSPEGVKEFRTSIPDWCHGEAVVKRKLRLAEAKLRLAK